MLLTAGCLLLSRDYGCKQLTTDFNPILRDIKLFDKLNTGLLITIVFQGALSHSDFQRS